MRRGLGVLAVVLGVLPGTLPAEDASVVERALRDELARTMEELRLGDLERPYFVSYRVDDVTTLEIEAVLGSLIASDTGRRRALSVEVRVGDYAFDNTNFFSLSSLSTGPMVLGIGDVRTLPLDDDYREIRRQAWLATDAAYKAALEKLAEKKAALRHRIRSPELPDFSRVTPAEIRAGPPVATPDRARGETLARRVSALFGEMADIVTSKVEYQASSTHTLYLNSEGTFYTRTLSDVYVAALAATRTADGMWLEDAVIAFGRQADDLPPFAALSGRVRALGRFLTALRQAERLERYNGPVLFEAEAAAELVAQLLAPKLLAQRQPESDDEVGSFGHSDADFKDRLGARVLPRNLSVVDDPKASEAGGARLLGGFPVDDEGVSGGATLLVERGFLRTLLADRVPVDGVPVSSGNRRAGGVAPSNLIFRVEKDGHGDDELRRELLERAAERGLDFGLVVRRLASPWFRAVGSPSSFGDGSSVETPVAVYKVYGDGREMLVRGLKLADVNARLFREIVAVGERPRVLHRPFRALSGDPMGGFSPELPLVSLVVPALVFEEMTWKAADGERSRPPVLPHPLAARGGR